MLGFFAQNVSGRNVFGQNFFVPKVSGPRVQWPKFLFPNCETAKFYFCVPITRAGSIKRAGRIFTKIHVNKQLRC